MAKAKSVHSTQRLTASKERAKRDKQLATAYMQMEGDVCDIDRMGDITERLINEFVDDKDDVRRLELANFAMQHLADMLRQFKRKYYSDNFSNSGRE